MRPIIVFSDIYISSFQMANKLPIEKYMGKLRIPALSPIIKTSHSNFSSDENIINKQINEESVLFFKISIIPKHNKNK